MVLSPWLRVIARVHSMNATQRRMAANPQTKANNLGCESAENLLPSSTFTIAMCYYYSARKLILILPSHGGWKAEST